jgi:hypothetical protein
MVARDASAHRKSVVLRGHVKDLDHAIRELTTARDEMAALNASPMYGYQRRTALIEPIARLKLVRRYLDEMIDASEPRTR